MSFFADVGGNSFWRLKLSNLSIYCQIKGLRAADMSNYDIFRAMMWLRYENCRAHNAVGSGDFGSSTH